jgi:hypothetical protein
MRRAVVEADHALKSKALARRPLRISLHAGSEVVKGYDINDLPGVNISARRLDVQAVTMTAVRTGPSVIENDAAVYFRIITVGPVPESIGAVVDYQVYELVIWALYLDPVSPRPSIFGQITRIGRDPVRVRIHNLKISVDRVRAHHAQNTCLAANDLISSRVRRRAATCARSGANAIRIGRRGITPLISQLNYFGTDVNFAQVWEVRPVGQDYSGIGSANRINKGG